MIVTSLKLRSDLHIARKLWHMLALLAIIICYHNLDRPDALRTFCVGSAVFIVFDFLRLRFRTINKLAFSVFGPVMRKHEADSLAGSTYMAIGVLIIAFIFPKPVVKLTLFFLAAADPLASYIGLKYGKDRIIGKKTLQGSMAAFVACTVIAFIFYHSAGMMQGRLVVASLFSGVIGALAELIPVGKLDDNFTFPLFASSALWALFYIYGVWS